MAVALVFLVSPASLNPNVALTPTGAIATHGCNRDMHSNLLSLRLGVRGRGDGYGVGCVRVGMNACDPCAVLFAVQALQLQNNNSLANPIRAQVLHGLGADPNAVNTAGNTPMHWAAIGGQTEALKVTHSTIHECNIRLDLTPAHCASRSPLALVIWRICPTCLGAICMLLVCGLNDEQHAPGADTRNPEHKPTLAYG